MLGRARQTWRALTRKPKMDEELDEELSYHLAQAIQQNIARGMTPDEAQRAALIGLGGIERRKEECRDAHAAVRWLSDFIRDLRHGGRMLLRHRGLTFVVVLMLGLGIGANTAIFSLLNSLLVKELPAKDPRGLIFVRRSSLNGEMEGYSYPAFERIRDYNRSFSGLCAIDNSRLNVTVTGEPEMVWGDFVSGNYFDVLGISAALGRTFSIADDKPGAKPVAVLGHGYWERTFSSDPAVIGAAIFIGKIPFTIIGVAPKGFAGLYPLQTTDVVLPMSVHPELGLADHNTFLVLGRLNPAVSLDSAGADIDGIYRQYLTEYPDSTISTDERKNIDKISAKLRPGRRGLTGDSDDLAKEIEIVFAVVAVVLLIASVNIANLLLARSASRGKEMVVRLALGSGRGRLIRQLLTEALMLAALGGAAGLFASSWGAKLLVSALSFDGAPIPIGLELNTTVLAFAAAISILTALLFGLIPALTCTRVDLARVLNEGGRDSQPPRKRLAKVLVTSQVALSIVLLIGAGLLLRTLGQLSGVNPGFPSGEIMSMRVYPVLVGYSHERELKLYREILGKLDTTPGVKSAALTRFSLAFRSGPVSPGFFKTTGIALIEGREFADTDSESAAKVAVINESTARRLFPNEDAIGRRLPVEEFDLRGVAPNSEITIVGVARDVKHQLRGQARDREVYIPYTQAPAEMLGQAEVLVRTSAAPKALAPSIRQQVRSVEPDLTLLNLQTVAEEMGDDLSEERSLAELISWFGALAVALASIGLYGTLSYAIGKRTRELGIRMALGASRKSVLQMVLVET
ncbi:MAG TPA: ABC transporter permease, partial [Blastocatellia bacterium]|nr:ABC transporter permease [Blastocatellia bacterium]